MAHRMTAAAITVKRIRFAAEPASGEAVRCRFTEPRPIAAVEASSELAALPVGDSGPEPFDDLFVIVAFTRLPADLEAKVKSWLSQAVPPVVVKIESGAIRWRPGRAVIECADAESNPAGMEGLLDALAGFAFLEGELRRLERALIPFEASAPGDVPLAYRIRQSAHATWDRLGETVEALAVLRLTFARLEPLFSAPPRSLAPEARRAATLLASRSRVPARLESLSNRLEALEDLYEGAVDRITDFRWYRKGEILETTIIVLLAVEVALLVGQMFWR